MLDVTPAVRMVLARRAEAPRERGVLAGVTGIDGSGKGYVTGLLAAGLEAAGARVAAINVDGWLEVPSRRFGTQDPARHFYEHAIRFDELFGQLILPLKAKRSLRLEADLADATNSEAFRRHTYAFEDVGVILLEGIFLLKRAYRDHFDLSLWVDCTFETALERALRRAQEGLPPEETVRAYETVYFPAQRIHLERDDPRAFATAVLPNDPRLSAPSGGP
jgi:uridine kinase